MAQKPILEDLENEDRRSPPIGFFNFAETYWIAANALKKANTKSSHKDFPIRFLYYHAIELYLKAYLRSQGVHAATLRSKKFGRDPCKISREAERRGLELTDEDRLLFWMMSETEGVIRTRYIQVGAARWPEIDALDRTCRRLRVLVSNELKKAGHPARLQTS